MVFLAPLDALRSRASNQPVKMTLFKAGMHTIVYSSAAFAFGAFAEYGAESVETPIFIGIAAATVTSVLVNAALSPGVSSWTAASHRERSGTSTPGSIPHFVAMGFVGAWLNVAYIDHGLSRYRRLHGARDPATRRHEAVRR